MVDAMHSARHAAVSVRCAASYAERDKQRAFDCTGQACLAILDASETPALGFHFRPLVFDTVGAAASQVVATVMHHAALVLLRTASTPALAELRIWETLSFAVCWPPYSLAILPRPLFYLPHDLLIASLGNSATA